MSMNTTAVDFLEHDGALFAALYGLDRGVSRSTVGGVSFAPSDAGVASNAVMKCLHAHGDVLFAASWDALYRSTNGGVSWASVPSMPNVQRFVSIGSVLFAGRYGSGAAVSTDAGLTWTAINAGLPSGASTFLNDLVSLDGTVYAAINDGGGVRRWNGSSWVSVGLAGTIVNELLAVDGVLIAGSALEGVWTSIGNGAWTPLDDGYFGGEVYELGTTSDRVVLGSRGHGLWSLPRSELPAATSVLGDAAATAGASRIVVAPNPFRPATELRFSVVRTGPVRLTIHDVAGRRVRDLVQARTPAGEHVVRWDGRDARGVAVPAGVYFARLAQAAGSTTEKVVRTR
jgi:hypothetical protein